MGQNSNKNQTYYLNPGYIYLPESRTSISTVLGSCVSVIIYDIKKRIGGMNHFLLPSPDRDFPPKTIYGDIATGTLIKMFFKRGSKKTDLEAQIFGGSFNDTYSEKDIGKLNIIKAREVLKKFGLQFASEDVGGIKGRKIIFDSYTNEIAIIRVDKLRQSDWFPYQSK